MLFFTQRRTLEFTELCTLELILLVGRLTNLVINSIIISKIYCTYILEKYILAKHHGYYEKLIVVYIFSLPILTKLDNNFNYLTTNVFEIDCRSHFKVYTVKAPIKFYKHQRSTNTVQNNVKFFVFYLHYLTFQILRNCL